MPIFSLLQTFTTQIHITGQSAFLIPSSCLSYPSLPLRQSVFFCLHHLYVHLSTVSTARVISSWCYISRYLQATPKTAVSNLINRKPSLHLNSRNLSASHLTLSLLRQKSIFFFLFLIYFFLFIYFTPSLPVSFCFHFSPSCFSSLSLLLTSYGEEIATVFILEWMRYQIIPTPFHRCFYDLLKWMPMSLLHTSTHMLKTSQMEDDWRLQRHIYIGVKRKYKANVYPQSVTINSCGMPIGGEEVSYSIICKERSQDRIKTVPLIIKA